MDNSGLINKLFAVTINTWNAHCLLNDSREKITLDETRKETLQVLKDVGRSKDISIVLGSEVLMLNLELENYANSPEEANSIKTALMQLEEAQKSLVVVRDVATYTAVAETYSSKRKEAGLPLDSFREFLKSHTTRLTNRLAAPLPVPEKNILRQRKENLRVVKELYVGMQREALGLGQEKGHGQEMER